MILMKINVQGVLDYIRYIESRRCGSAISRRLNLNPVQESTFMIHMVESSHLGFVLCRFSRGTLPVEEMVRRDET
jgi:hypothetical protein